MVTTTTTTTIAIRVGRRTCHDKCLLGEVDLGDDGGGDLDLKVGLRTVVDGRRRHCDKKRFAGKAVLSD